MDFRRLHSTDLIWAVVALFAAAYPLLRLRHYRNRQSARDFFWIIVILGTYPVLMASFHLTPFDIGLVYSTTVFLAPLYFLVMTRFLRLRLPRVTWVRGLLFTGSAALSLLALTNPWHQQFAVFHAHVSGQPNHLLDYSTASLGMQIMQGITFMLVTGTALMALVQFAAARFHFSQALIAIAIPVLAMISFATSERANLLAQWEVSGFMAATTLLLVCLNYALARNHFVEVGLVTRTKIVGLIPDAMVIVSATGTIIDCNEAFERLYLTQSQKILGQPLLAHFPKIAAVVNTGESQAELCQTIGSREQHFDVRIQALSNSLDATDKVVLLRDVTEQTQVYHELTRSQAELTAANAKLEHLSLTDALTGLRNRRYFDQALDTEQQRYARYGDRFGLLSIDLDKFKLINDKHGHGAGDRVLSTVSRVMEYHCRGNDTLARVGGEEFMVLLLNIDEKFLAIAAERLRSVIAAEPVLLDDGTVLHVTASLGGVLVAAGETNQALMTRLDNALYQSKAQGRNQVSLTTV